SPHIFCLPDRISVSEENALMPFLQASRDAPVEIAAAGLQRFDTRLIQSLIAAAADWRARGFDFRITGLGPDHAEVLARLGVTAGHLCPCPAPPADTGTLAAADPQGAA